MKESHFVKQCRSHQDSSSCMLAGSFITNSDSILALVFYLSKIVNSDW